MSQQNWREKKGGGRTRLRSLLFYHIVTLVRVKEIKKMKLTEKEYETINLDPGIKDAVRILMEGEIEIFES